MKILIELPNGDIRTMDETGRVTISKNPNIQLPEIKFSVGQIVRKIKPKNDYTFGRTGEIVEIGYKKIRVRWIKEFNGDFVTTCGAKPGNGVRTWINPANIELI